MISQKFYLAKTLNASQVNWDAFKHNELTDIHVEVIRMTSILEYSSLPSAVSMLNQTGDDIDLRSFIFKWAYDEQKHAFILKEYSDRFLQEPSSLIGSYEEVSVNFSESKMNIAEIMALHMCTEITVSRWYRKMAAWHTEPLIKQIYNSMANDEASHAGAFKSFLSKYLNDENKKGVLAIFQLFLSKNNFISLKVSSTTDIEKQSIYSRLPNPNLFDHMIDNIIKFDDSDRKNLQSTILKIATNLCGHEMKTPLDLKQYRKSL